MRMVEKWTCAVCKSCSFDTLRKQRLMKRCVLPRRAWSKNGRVMYASPVHLILLRKQRLMKNSAFSFPCAGDAK